MDTLELINKIKTEENPEKKSYLIESLLENEVKNITSITSKYVSKDVPIDDLNQEAFISFVEAINTFDTSKNVSFKTFYSRKIESRLKIYKEEIKNEFTVPQELVNSLNNILDTEEALLKKLKRNPSEKEVASALSISLTELKNYKSYAAQALSIDVSNFEGKSDVTLTEMLKYQNTFSNDSANDTNEISEDLELILESLKPTEREIFTKHLGLYGPAKSIEDLALEYNVSKEKIRSIISYAKRTIKYQMEENNEN